MSVGCVAGRQGKQHERRWAGEASPLWAGVSILLQVQQEIGGGLSGGMGGLVL